MQCLQCYLSPTWTSLWCFANDRFVIAFGNLILYALWLQCLQRNLTHPCTNFWWLFLGFPIRSWCRSSANDNGAMVRVIINPQLTRSQVLTWNISLQHFSFFILEIINIVTDKKHISFISLPKEKQLLSLPKMEITAACYDICSLYTVGDKGGHSR